MQIQKCVITKPGLLANRILAFDAGISIVYGRNDSGKSLISRAMIDALWGEFGGGSMLAGGAWDDLYLEIFFNTESGQYRFIRDGIKTFQIKQIESLVEKEIFHKSIHGGGEGISGIPEQLKKDREASGIFGKIDTVIFRNISFMPSPMEIAQDGRIDGKAFEWLTLDDRSSFYPVYQGIKAEFGKGGTGQGSSNFMLTEILNAESLVKDIDRKIQISEIQTAKGGRLREESKRREEEIEAFRGELSEIRTAKTVLGRVQKELERLDEINKTLDNKTGELKAEEEKSSFYRKLTIETDDHFRQFRNFSEANIANLRKIEEAYRDVRNIYEAIDKHGMDEKKKKTRFKKILFSINIYLLIIAITLFFISSDRIPVLKFYRYYFSGVIVFLAAVLSSIISVLHMISFRRKEIKKIMQDKSDIEMRLKGLLNANNITLDEYRLEILYEFLVQYFEDYAEYTIRQTELGNIKKSLKDEAYLCALRDETEKLEKEANKIRSGIALELRDLGAYGDIKPDLNSINSRIQEFNSRIKLIKGDIKSNEDIIARIAEEAGQKKDNLDEKDLLLSEKRKAEESLANLMSYKNSIAFIAEIMEQAIKSRRENQLMKLIKYTRENFHFLTDKQYGNIVDNEYIRGIISGNDAGGGLNPSVYYILLLSIKLAATFLLTDFDIALPLIIDEPFLFIDNTRVTRLKEILDNIAAERQIIIFTHNNNYKDWGSYIQL